MLSSCLGGNGAFGIGGLLKIRGIFEGYIGVIYGHVGICRVQDFLKLGATFLGGLHTDDSILGSMLDHIRGTPYALSKDLECKDPPEKRPTPKFRF